MQSVGRGICGLDWMSGMGSRFDVRVKDRVDSDGEIWDGLLDINANPQIICSIYETPW